MSLPKIQIYVRSEFDNGRIIKEDSGYLICFDRHSGQFAYLKQSVTTKEPSVLVSGRLSKSSRVVAVEIDGELIKPNGA